MHGHMDTGQYSWTDLLPDLSADELRSSSRPDAIRVLSAGTEGWPPI